MIQRPAHFLSYWRRLQVPDSWCSYLRAKKLQSEGVRLDSAQRYQPTLQLVGVKLPGQQVAVAVQGANQLWAWLGPLTCQGWKSKTFEHLQGCQGSSTRGVRCTRKSGELPADSQSASRRQRNHVGHATRQLHGLQHPAGPLGGADAQREVWL